jgi:hypothetical protein
MIIIAFKWLGSSISGAIRCVNIEKSVRMRQLSAGPDFLSKHMGLCGPFTQFATRRVATHKVFGDFDIWGCFE